MMIVATPLWRVTMMVAARGDRVAPLVRLAGYAAPVVVKRVAEYRNRQLSGREGHSRRPFEISTHTIVSSGVELPSQ